MLWQGWKVGQDGVGFAVGSLSGALQKEDGEPSVGDALELWIS